MQKIKIKQLKIYVKIAMVKLLNKKLQSYRGGALRPCHQHISSIQKINKIKTQIVFNLTSEKKH